MLLRKRSSRSPVGSSTTAAWSHGYVVSVPLCDTQKPVGSIVISQCVGPSSPKCSATSRRILCVDECSSHGRESRLVHIPAARPPSRTQAERDSPYSTALAATPETTPAVTIDCRRHRRARPDRCTPRRCTSTNSSKVASKTTVIESASIRSALPALPGRPNVRLHPRRFTIALSAVGCKPWLDRCLRQAIRYPFSTPRESTAFVRHEALSDHAAEPFVGLNLGACPHSEFQDVLELVCQVVPAVVVAQGVRRKIVVFRVSAAAAVGKYVIRLPCADDRASTDV